jgi:hypothetical protein
MTSVGEEGQMMKRCQWLCAVIAAGLLLAGCSYTEEDSWNVCCSLVVVSDEVSSSQARMTIMNWQRTTSFRADGSAVELIGSKSNTLKKLSIEKALAEFQAANPDRRPVDYFTSVGMTCSPAVARSNAFSCEVELPIAFGCYSLNVYFPWGAPVPAELRNPMPGYLQMKLDVASNGLLNTTTRIAPVPGGRLCQRQRS